MVPRPSLNVLKLCALAGLTRVGTVAWDGTKIKANASRHKAMSYDCMKEGRPEATETLMSADQAIHEEEILRDKISDQFRQRRVKQTDS